MSTAELTREQIGVRARRVLDTSGHVALSTVAETGLPWSTPVHYVWFGRPLRLLFASMLDAHHSRNIANQEHVSGSLVTHGGIQGSESDVDGAQFTGQCVPVPDAESAHWHAEFFRRILPDPDARDAWMLPLSYFRAPERHRLYMLSITQWWFPDLAGWVRDRVDRRFEVALDDLDAALG